MGNSLNGHLRSLTGLRFFAALLVVLFHLPRFFDPISSASTVFGLGYTGVGFFFILSGFVLAWARKPDDTAPRFYWRRFARVWPLHALTTVLSVPVAILTGAAITWAALIPVLTLTQAWFVPNDFRYAFNGVSWSLSVELFFYLLFPVLMRHIPVRRPIVTAAAAFVLMCLVALTAAFLFSPARLEYLLYTMPAFRLGEFIIGICLAVLIRSGWRPPFTLRTATLAAVAAYTFAMVATNITVGDPTRLPHVVADLWLVPGFVAIILAGASGDVRGDSGWLRSPRCVDLGYWSFALYLIHELIIRAVEPWADTLPTSVCALIAAGVVILAVVASKFLYERFERPVEARLRALEPRTAKPVLDGHV